MLAMRLCIVTLLLSALVACGGSAGGEPGAGPTPASPSQSAQERDARYGSVEALKEAAERAGLACAIWDQDDVVTLAAESGSCYDDHVLATFATEQDLQDQVDTYRSLSDLSPDMVTLVGPNWMVHGPGSAELQEELGGVVER